MGPQLALLALRLPTLARKILFAKAHNGVLVLTTFDSTGGIMENKPVVKVNGTCCPAQINNDLLQSLIELVDKIKYFPGELSKEHYAVKRAEKLIDNTK